MNTTTATDMIASSVKTTTVDLVIRLQIEGSPAEVERFRGALINLADVMRVQAEEGLWLDGYRDDSEYNKFLADTNTSEVHAVLIDGKENP